MGNILHGLNEESKQQMVNKVFNSHSAQARGDSTLDLETAINIEGVGELKDTALSAKLNPDR